MTCGGNSILDNLEMNQVHVEWIPSHLDEVACSQLKEEWVARWNNHADALAIAAQTGRSRHVLDALGKVAA